MNLEERIKLAFSHRQRPRDVVSRRHPNTNEWSEAESFEAISPGHLDTAFLDANSDAIFAFTPEAFCYFLPGIMLAGIRKDAPNLIVNSMLTNTLDRSPNPDYWENFFRERWLGLTLEELSAVAEWVKWLDRKSPGYFRDGSLSRVLETLELIALVRAGC